MQSARGPLRPGSRVGRFVVREEIGFGATSIVYEAEHRTVRHRVAVKVLRPSAAADGELRQRFEREMALCSTIVSTHLPHVYEVGELPSGLPFIVMERLEGASLADWLAAHRRLPVGVVVEIGIQLCAGLAALHQRDVVHRDVKPENLVLHRTLEGGHVVKLVDLGICKPMVPDGPAITARGTVVGTPRYMSPEQVQGHALDLRTDVYSTGVVLYELLVGRAPFEDADLDALARAILFGHPPRLTSQRPEVDAVLEGIVMRALARERGDRPPSAVALRRELERFADAQALRRHPEVWTLLPSRPMPRTLPPPPPGPEPDARPATEPTIRLPRRRSGLAAGAAAGVGVIAVAGASLIFLLDDTLLDDTLLDDFLLDDTAEPAHRAATELSAEVPTPPARPEPRPEARPEPAPTPRAPPESAPPPIPEPAAVEPPPSPRATRPVWRAAADPADEPSPPRSTHARAQAREDVRSREDERSRRRRAEREEPTAVSAAPEAPEAPEEPEPEPPEPLTVPPSPAPAEAPRTVILPNGLPENPFD